MSDKKITFKINAESKSAEKNINAFEKKLAQLGLGGVGRGLAALGSTLTGITSAFSIVSKTVSTAAKAIKDLSEASKNQVRAETQLESAAKNNPYLNSTSVTQLKEFATGLEKIGNKKDEVILPLMASLAAAGRTQAEIQKIITAALDVSAGGTISLESAVKNLNKTYSGTAGELGETIPQVKSLTAEQLKQGKAVEIVAKQYAGMSESTTKATGASEQLGNAWGTLKEHLGAAINGMLGPWIRFLTMVINGANNVSQKIKDLGNNIDASAGDIANNKTVNWDKTTLALNIKKAESELSAKQKAYEEAQKTFSAAQKRWNKASASDKNNPTNVQWWKEKQDAYRNAGDAVITAADKLSAAKDALTAAQYSADAKKKAAEQAALVKSAQALQGTYEKSIQTEKDKIALDKSVGKEVSDTDEKQRIANATYDAYIQLLQSSQTPEYAYLERAGFVSKATNQVKKAFKDLADAQKDTKKSTNEVSDALNNYAAKYSARTKKEESADEQKSDLQDIKNSITDYYNALPEDQRIAVEEQYLAAVKEIYAEINDIDKQTNEQRIARVQKIMQSISYYFSKSSDILSNAVSLYSDKLETETELKNTELEKQYALGEMTEEEYQARKTQIEKDGAKEKYKIDMLSWVNSCAQAAANTALGITQALSEQGMPTWAKIVNAAIIGTSATIQAAALISSKPVPPSFATGGIVPGTSYTGDNVDIKANSGEFIINDAQQAKLANVIFGNGKSSTSGMNVTINNKASNIASATPVITKKGLELTIDARVQEALANGMYNKSLAAANGSMSGKMYGL